MRKKTTTASAETRTATTQFAPPPPPSGADAIDLSTLLGETIGVRIESRKEVETKFGERPMAYVTILSARQREPLRGVLFASYFTKLEIGAWYMGTVAQTDGKRRAWMLSPETDKAAARKICELASALDLDEVPF